MARIAVWHPTPSSPGWAPATSSPRLAFGFPTRSAPASASPVSTRRIAAAASRPSPCDSSRRGTKRTRKTRVVVPASTTVDERGTEKEADGTAVADESRADLQVNGSRRDDARGWPSVAGEGTGDRKIEEEDLVWQLVCEEARSDSVAEPALASYLYSTILAHRSLEKSLAFHLGNKLSSATFLSTHLVTVFIDAFMEDDLIRKSIRADIIAVKERDPACVSHANCLLNFKGFLALQSHRVAHRLWTHGRRSLALAMQSRVSEVFHVDIHPGAVVGRGILLDHATGVVVGETAVIGDNVSMLHHVTLGGTGAMVGERHPKIGDGVLIGARAVILGDIKIGEGAKIGAGSVVLTDVPAHATAVGNPARLVIGKNTPARTTEAPSKNMDHTSFIDDWSSYEI